eukprot:6172749-Pleurochrysis_carterae.AAC.2
MRPGSYKRPSPLEAARGGRSAALLSMRLRYTRGSQRRSYQNFGRHMKNYRSITNKLDANGCMNMMYVYIPFT